MAFLFIDRVTVILIFQNEKRIAIFKILSELLASLDSPFHEAPHPHEPKLLPLARQFLH
ncbi:hypothetical protein IJH23_01355 [Candidatus Saccharibacteria bacterium]|nr:hypothetical protein [Candidatus Saccharibacteria bacterium]